MPAPSPAAIAAAEAALVELRRASPATTGLRATAKARKLALRAGLEAEPEPARAVLRKATDEALMQWVLALLDDLRCVDRAELTPRYERVGWGGGTTNMPTAAQVRQMIPDPPAAEAAPAEPAASEAPVVTLADPAAAAPTEPPAP